MAPNSGVDVAAQMPFVFLNRRGLALLAFDVSQPIFPSLPNRDTFARRDVRA